MIPELEEIEIKSGSHRAKVSAYGASLRSYAREEASKSVDILWGYSGTANKRGGQGDVLIPFPGRLVGGAYAFGGRTHSMKRNDKDGPNAIHGFLRTQHWEVVKRSLDRVEFTRSIRPHEFEGYPFEIEATVSYQVSESGLECGFRVRNLGSEAAPVGVGFHPYFTVGSSRIDDALLTSPARDIIELGPNLLPTGKLVPVEGSEMDFRKPRPIGSLRINHCLCSLQRDADGMARVELSDSTGTRKTVVWMDSSFPYLVLYTGDAVPGGERLALAIEPMTCATDAFNRPEWGLKALKPGETFSGRYGITESSSP